MGKKTYNAIVIYVSVKQFKMFSHVNKLWKFKKVMTLFASIVVTVQPFNPRRDPDQCVQKQEILCSCWEGMGSIHRSCCPSQTFASPSRDQVSSRCSLSPHTIPAVWVTRTTSVAAHLKVGCDNTVVRMVSSGKFVSRVSFSYRLLDSQELQTIKLNNVEDFCLNNWLQHHRNSVSFDWIHF